MMLHINKEEWDGSFSAWLSACSSEYSWNDCLSVSALLFCPSFQDGSLWQKLLRGIEKNNRINNHFGPHMCI